MKNIAIFASGSGTNAENIIAYFNGKTSAKVKLILCNNPQAGVLERARKHGVECRVFSSNDLKNSPKVTDLLEAYSIDYIVLAGFLLLLPESVTGQYGGRIVNIHPSLLPKFGGKGMYGDRVHEAVLAAGEAVSGITIHHVDGNLDEGTVIFQAKLDVLPDDTPESLASRIHQLEYKHYPRVIESEIIRLS